MVIRCKSCGKLLVEFSKGKARNNIVCYCDTCNNKINTELYKIRLSELDNSISGKNKNSGLFGNIFGENL